MSSATATISAPYFSGKYATDPTRRVPGLPELRPAFRRCVLAHDGARIGAARFLKRAQGAERARIVDRADQRSPRLAVAQVPPHRLEAFAELAVAVEMRHLALLEMREDFFHADQHPVRRIFGRLPARSSVISTISSTSVCQCCLAQRPR